MFLRRFGYKLVFLAYWLFFAILSTFAAKSPGYVRHPDLAPYPWPSLFTMVMFLAVLVAAFYAVLMPPRFRTSYWRLPLALVLGAAMLGASVLTTGTDMPGLSYMPLVFSFLSLLFLIVISASTAVAALWRKLRATP